MEILAVDALDVLEVAVPCVVENNTTVAERAEDGGAVKQCLEEEGDARDAEGKSDQARHRGGCGVREMANSKVDANGIQSNNWPSVPMRSHPWPVDCNRHTGHIVGMWGKRWARLT